MDSQTVWKWVTRVGGVVGLIGGSFAIYEFFQPIDWLAVMLFFLWLSATSVFVSSTHRSQRTHDTSQRLEAKVDRLLAHFKIDQSDD